VGPQHELWPGKDEVRWKPRRGLRFWYGQGRMRLGGGPGRGLGFGKDKVRRGPGRGLGFGIAREG